MLIFFLDRPGGFAVMICIPLHWPPKAKPEKNVVTIKEKSMTKR